MIMGLYDWKRNLTLIFCPHFSSKNPEEAELEDTLNQVVSGLFELLINSLFPLQIP